MSATQSKPKKSDNKQSDKKKSAHASALEDFITQLKRQNPHEPEFVQAVTEVAESVVPFIQQNKQYAEGQLLERLCEPERVIIFRVPWLDDEGNYRINRGYRVQMSSALGPFKGGTRFSPDVNLSTLKFLAFEQIFKNSLTTLPLGAGKGGADFDPRGKSDAEVMKFCQSFMTELHKYIGPETDVPAGDMGVGSREIGYLFGQYKRLTGRYEGVLTGKDRAIGGSYMRPEATGYGAVYFAEQMLKARLESLEGKVCAVSGSGNVALHAARKLVALGAKVITLSDSDGFIHDAAGFDDAKLDYIFDLKLVQRGRIREYANAFDAKFHAEAKPWQVPCDVAFPCAVQNEIAADDAKALVKNGCQTLVEGANMPCTAEAVAVLRQAEVRYAPGKAANAGGVAVSGLEMVQNRAGQYWTAEQVDDELRRLMAEIHAQCVQYGKAEGSLRIDYVTGANVGGFVRAAEALRAQGLV